MKLNKEYPDIVFETSWEVCNKVGGIYAVLSTKAKTLQSLCGNQLIFVGPDIWTKENPSPFFKESKTLLADWRKNGILPEGLNVRVGKWNIPGLPIVILVDYKNLYPHKNQLYAEMWNTFQVDSLHAYGDYDESCVFAYGAALVIESYYTFIKSKKSKENVHAIAHFDEWTTGAGLLYLKRNVPNIATVFTTHATSIGRSICGNNKPLYDYLEAYDGDQMACELNMQSKHSLEKAAALNADSFTTVSDVTAKECEQLLGRKPIVTPNGFELTFVPSKTKFQQARTNARKTLLRVAQSLTGCKLDDDTMLIATSGRNEFRNKGLDAFIDSMNVLRNKEGKLAKQIVAFIMVPAWVESPRKDLAEASICNNGNKVQLENPIITHNLFDYSSDSVYAKLNYLGMHNAQHEDVKVIYVPSYLNGDDGIFNISYYDLLIGFDCAIFASYYEPWGYTPLESVAFGVPTITTDLSGFGQWVLLNFKNELTASGVRVIHRTDSNYNSVVDQIGETVHSILDSDKNTVNEIVKAAFKTAKKASWENFITDYQRAYAEALKNADCRNNQ